MTELGGGASADIDRLALSLTTSASRFTRAAGKVAGVTHSVGAWRTLAVLEANGPQRVTDLAASERITQPSMTGLLQRLEGEGYVTRSEDPADRRATRVSLTGEGAIALGAYRRAAAARIRPELDALAPADREVLARAADLLAQIAASPGLT